MFNGGQPMHTFSLRVCVFVTALLCCSWSAAQQAYVVNDNTPVIFSDKTHVLVQQAASEYVTWEDIRKLESQFVPASSFTQISPVDYYWI